MKSQCSVSKKKKTPALFCTISGTGLKAPVSLFFRDRKAITLIFKLPQLHESNQQRANSAFIEIYSLNPENIQRSVWDKANPKHGLVLLSRAGCPEALVWSQSWLLHPRPLRFYLSTPQSVLDSVPADESQGLLCLCLSLHTNPGILHLFLC